MNIKVDLGGALRKTATLAKVPQAALRQLKRWGANSVKDLQREAAGMKKSGSGRKTGQLARAVGRLTRERMLIVGTNVNRETDVKYARIQDEGGTIRAKKKCLAIPLKGVKMRARDYPDAFVITSKKGNVLLVQQKWGKVRGGENSVRKGLTPLFLLKPEVHLPATRWFSGTMMRMESLLPGYMDERVILDEAAKMAGVGGV
jgi:hypothetical protein